MNDNCSSLLLNRLFSLKSSDPDSVAFVDKSGARETTWKEFINIVNAISSYLISNNIKKGDIVAIDFDRSMEHIAARISCFAIGAVFLSLSEHCPSERRNIIFEDCKPKLCIDADVLKVLDMHCEKDIRDESLTDEDLGYIVYTSGSLGKPKGVLHNRTIFHSYQEVLNVFEHIPWNSGFASLTDSMFIMSIVEMVALFFGIPYHIIDDNIRQNPVMLREYFVKHKIFVSIMLPSLLYYMGPIDTLKVAFIAGESCSFNFDNFDTRIINSYGMSECPFIMFGDAKNNWILDNYLGESKVVLDNGEFCYKGAGIMVRYINDSIQSPVIDGFLHTGDLAKEAGKDTYLLRGRKDAEVKINGQRVNTSEVEHYLTQVEGVAVCCVVKSGNRLVAYYTSNTMQEINSENFTKLKSYLPDYAVPSTFVHTKFFKRNQHGKIDRVYLSSIEIADKREEYVKPSTKAQKDICAAYEKVLNKKNVGIKDRFENLGGSSMEAVALLSQLDEYCLSFNDIFELQTPEKLAMMADSSEVPKFEPRDKYKLSNSTLYMHDLYYDLDEELVRDYPYYTVTVLVSFKHIKPQTFINAWKQVIDNHPMLKAKIEGDCFVRRDDWEPSIEIEELDFEPDKEFFTKQIMPIDYSKDDLVRSKVFTYKSKTYFLSDINHIVCDGYSAMILVKDLISALLKKKLAKEIVSGFDYSLRYQKELKADVNNKFFKKIENGDKATLIPKSGKNHTKLALSSSRDVLVNKDIVDKVCKEHNIPKSIIFMAATVLAIAKTEQFDEVNFIYLNNGRRYEYLKNTVSCLYEFCPIFYKIRPCENIVDVAKRLIVMCNENIKYCYAYELNRMLRDNANIVFNYIGDLGSTGGGLSARFLSMATKLFDFSFERLDVQEGSFMKILINAVDYDDDNYQLTTWADSSFYGDASELKFCNYWDEHFDDLMTNL